MDNSSETRMLVESIPRMARPQLVAQWKLQFGSPPHPKLRIELMRPVLAYRVQENASNVPKRRIQGRLKDALTSANAARFKPGTRIVREWKGQIHEVLVGEEGYLYKDEKFKSLSPIATRITGTKWSGPAFFGTKPKDRVK